MTHYSVEEKIDYVFRELKSQKRSRISKQILVLLFIWTLIFWYYTFIDWADKDEIIEKVSLEISKIITPITQNIIDWMVDENNPNIDSK